MKAKGGDIQLAYLAPRALKLLRRYLRERPASAPTDRPWLFCNWADTTNSKGSLTSIFAGGLPEPTWTWKHPGWSSNSAMMLPDPNRPMWTLDRQSLTLPARCCRSLQPSLSGSA